jgi:predicted metal-binding transcription factor (methanogenesis marker protein 9)
MERTEKLVIMCNRTGKKCGETECPGSLWDGWSCLYAIPTEIKEGELKIINSKPNIIDELKRAGIKIENHKKTWGDLEHKNQI